MIIIIKTTYLSTYHSQFSPELRLLLKFVSTNVSMNPSLTLIGRQVVFSKLWEFGSNLSNLDYALFYFIPFETISTFFLLLHHVIDVI